MLRSCDLAESQELASAAVAEFRRALATNPSFVSAATELENTLVTIGISLNQTSDAQGDSNAFTAVLEAADILRAVHKTSGFPEGLSRAKKYFSALGDVFQNH